MAFLNIDDDAFCEEICIDLPYKDQVRGAVFLQGACGHLAGPRENTILFKDERSCREIYKMMSTRYWRVGCFVLSCLFQARLGFIMNSIFLVNRAR